MRGWRAGFGLVLLALLTACAAPPPQKPVGVVAELQGSGPDALASQLAALRAPSAEGGRLIFIGAALNGREDVFDRDIRAFDKRLRPVFGDRYRAVLLSNVRVAASPRPLPLATIEHLDEVFDTLQQTRRQGDRYVVLMSTHGMPGWLEVEQAALWKTSRVLVSAKLAAWAQQLAPQPTWMLVSACFSGSHMAALKQDHLLVMTASDARSPSFGCNDKEVNTWFVRELLAALETDSDKALSHVWQRTLGTVAAQEKKLGLKPSFPQMQSSARMEPYLARPLHAF